jgi:nucleoside-diphosphate-sugar epimerase
MENIGHKVLVTGANGFIGRHVCIFLVEQGWMVYGAVRRSVVPSLPQGTQPVIIRNPNAKADWEAALQSVNSVIHLIGRAHVLREKAPNPLAEFHKVNVEITQRLLEGCAEQDIRRFIFLSSIAVVGQDTNGQPYTERTPCHPNTPYGITKLEAERRILVAAKEIGLEAAILRAPMIYGPGAKGNVLRLLRIMDRGIPIPFARVSNTRSVLYVGNLISAIDKCLKAPLATGEIFNVADTEVVSTRELAEMISSLIGRPIRALSIPPSWIRLLGHLLRCSKDADRMLNSVTVSSSKISNILDWTPPYSLEEGLTETVNWYRSTKSKRRL